MVEQDQEQEQEQERGEACSGVVMRLTAERHGGGNAPAVCAQVRRDPAGPGG